MSEAGSTIEVVSALSVKKLRDLEERMKSAPFDFKDGDVVSIDGIIEAIHELEDNCKELNGELEVTTIDASVLRHQLSTLPNVYAKELNDAVKSARQMNTDELETLQNKLTSINEHIDTLEGELRAIDEENAILHPQRDKERQEYEEIIMQMNQRLAEKAGKQIVLNETRDKLKQTTTKIVDLEDGIINLKEDLIQERADARMEKKRLKKAVYDTTLKTRERKEANIAKKREVDTLAEQVQESEAKLDDIRKSIKRYATSKSRLEGQERARMTQYKNQLKYNQELGTKGEDINKKIEEERTQHATLWKQLLSTDKTLREEIVEAKERNEELIEKEAQLAEELEEKMEVQMKEDKIVQAANEKLQQAKSRLADRAEEIGRLYLENSEMEQNLIELEESHEAIVMTLSKQIEEAREMVKKERIDRVELQKEQDALRKEIDDYEAESNNILLKLRNRVSEGKTRHDGLVSEEKYLRNALIDDDIAIKRMKEQKIADEKNLEEQKLALAKEISDLKEAMATLVKRKREKEQELEKETPLFEELEKHFNETKEAYALQNKSIVAAKSKKRGLEDSVSRSKYEIERLIGTENELKKNLKTNQKDTLEQIKSQSAELVDLETEIYNLGCKLKTVIEENSRFKQANAEMQKNLESIERQEKHNGAVQEKLSQSLLDGRDHLAEDWEQDKLLVKSGAARDKKLLGRFAQLLEDMASRESHLTEINEDLEDEIRLLVGFLDNVASRRPIDTKGKKVEKVTEVDEVMSVPSRPPSTMSTLSETRPAATLKPLVKLPPINDKE